MLHEGGLLIETRIMDNNATSPVALRTLLQLDGDRVVWIGRNAFASMSHYQRLRVAVRHRRVVRQRSVKLLNDARSWMPWLRYGFFALFGVHETGRGFADWPFVQLDWQAWLWHLVPGVALLAAGFVAPKVLAYAVPYILRWRAGATIRQRATARRQASKDYVASVRDA